VGREYEVTLNRVIPRYRQTDREELSKIKEQMKERSQ
jgi:hypothetical protein